MVGAGVRRTERHDFPGEEGGGRRASFPAGLWGLGVFDLCLPDMELSQVRTIYSARQWGLLKLVTLIALLNFDNKYILIG